ncbi:hypothetical protein [Olleya aquimaris]|uniref:LVIVD repeat-containing protein n=1 Tax=Olleya aquimaris TaxID=639310 RepID=A0A327RJC2_9FLAO|nr:hypothetical protein [Olleya aquimaris]RAJ17090.1 hypothetical protein LY08_00869 [Olleya aquimaris]
MKKITNYFSLFVLLFASSCWYSTNNIDDDISEPFIPTYQYEAVTMLRTEFENSTTLEEAKPIEETGKIYVKDNFLFINQPNKGFHVFNNSDPSNPINMAFIKVLGSTDLSIKNNILYINNATDLIAVKPDFSTNTIEVTKRVINTFPELVSPDRFSYHNTQPDEVIIDWILTQ